MDVDRAQMAVLHLVGIAGFAQPQQAGGGGVGLQRRSIVELQARRSQKRQRRAAASLSQ